MKKPCDIGTYYGIRSMSFMAFAQCLFTLVIGFIFQTQVYNHKIQVKLD